MPKPNKPADDLDTLVAAAASAYSPTQRRNMAAKARKAVKPKVGMGRPSKYSEKTASLILKALAEGKTMIKICADLNLGIETVYGWIQAKADFAESYRLARQQMAQSLVDEMVEDARTMDADTAIVHKVRSQIYQWTAARYAPTTFSDSKRIELKSEVNVRHVHELPIEQRKRIAESWLASQIEDDHTGIVIEHEPESGVSVISAPEREIPRRRKSPALPGKVKKSDPDSDGHWVGRRGIAD